MLKFQTPQSQTSINFRTKKFPQGIGILSFLVGILVIVGWVLDLPVLKTVLPGSVSMKFNTAFCFVLSGAALCLLCRKGGAWIRGMARGLVVLVFLMGFLTCLEYMGHYDLGIDQLVFLDMDETRGTALPGRMSPLTASSFVLLALALFFFDDKNRKRLFLAHFLAIGVCAISLLALLGYTYGIIPFYAISKSTGMALHTAVLFLALGLAVLNYCPDSSVMLVTVSGGNGGKIFRRLLPVAIALPFLFGGVKLILQRSPFYNPEFGIALYALMNIIAFTILIWLNARSLDQNEKARLAIRETIRRNFHKIETLKGLLPICASCKKIRDQQGGWNRLEHYIQTHSQAKFSHGICPDCAKDIYAEASVLTKPGEGMPNGR